MLGERCAKLFFALEAFTSLSLALFPEIFFLFSCIHFSLFLPPFLSPFLYNPARFRKTAMAYSVCLAFHVFERFRARERKENSSLLTLVVRVAACKLSTLPPLPQRSVYALQGVSYMHGILNFIKILYFLSLFLTLSGSV